ncbi:MAG: hypothetical protein M5R36_10925 [Deltaproteobacteria bacterium]|nr:hypothetical protein [Deltaproteobacteria bacterium]
MSRGDKSVLKKKIEIAKLRETAESIIQKTDQRRIFDSYVNESIVKTLIEKEKSRGGSVLNNWIIVFNWNQCCFVSWDVIGHDPDSAIQIYADYERQFPAEDGFEVVLIGSSRVANIRETHSHYFGLERKSTILESLESSVIGFSTHTDIDVGARQILACMHRKRFWGKKTVAEDTLKNHYCKDVLTFDSSLETLIQKGLVLRGDAVGPLALDIKKKKNIENYL